MSSIFSVINHNVVVPILPYQVDKLKNLAPGLAKKQLPPDQFCHKLGGYPLLVRVLLADQDSFPLYGGVWGVNLCCSVVVYQPYPGNVIKAKCRDRKNAVFSYMNSVNISVLKPNSADINDWSNELPPNGGSTNLVILGYGNSTPLTDKAPTTTRRRTQLATTKPEPVLYARLESDPEEEEEYSIPYGVFKPVKSKSSTRLSESEVESILSKVAAKPKETKEKPRPEIKIEVEETEVEETPKKKKKKVQEEPDISDLRIGEIKVEEIETPRKKKKKKDIQNEEMDIDDTPESAKKKKKKDSSDFVNDEMPIDEVSSSEKKKKKKKKDSSDFVNNEMATDEVQSSEKKKKKTIENGLTPEDVQHSGKKKKTSEVYIKKEPVSPEREMSKKRKSEDELVENPRKKKKRDLNNG